MNRIHVVGLGFAGFLSGLLSFFSLYALWLLQQDDQAVLISPLPGLIFGFIIGAYFYLTLGDKKLKRATLRILLFPFLSVGCYFIATVIAQIAILITQFLSLALAGAIGALLFLFAFMLCVYPVKQQRFLPIFIGGIASLVYWIGIHFPLPPTNYNFPFGSALLLLFPVWQSTIAATFGWIVMKSLVSGESQDNPSDQKIEISLPQS